MGAADNLLDREFEVGLPDVTALQHEEAGPQGVDVGRTIPLVNLSRDAVYRRLLAVADASSVLIALWVAGSLIAGQSLEPAVILAVPVVILVAKIFVLYDRDISRLHKETLDEIPVLLQLATLVTLLGYLAQGVLFSGPLDEGAVAVLWGSLALLLIATRALARAAAGALTPPERCLFVGERAQAREFARKLDLQGVRAEVVAVMSPPQPSSGKGNGNGNGADNDEILSRIAPLLRSHEIHRVILATGPWDADEILHSIGGLKTTGVRVSVLPDMSRIAAMSFDVDQLPGMALMGMRQFGMTQSSAIVKRAFDIGFSGVAIALLSPVLLAVAIAIKLDSRGPILFRQKRVGRNSEEFEMLKFRSMCDGADEQKNDLHDQDTAEGLFKLENDPRITRVGAWIRRYSLDELPQLFNVLNGQMSLVGPRPLIPVEDALILGPFRRRLEVRPGMTGHWQILGSLRVPLDEMVTLDYLYVANWSLWTDLKIVARTIPYLALRGNV